MILAALWNTADHDVAVTARLDLLQSMDVDQSVKIGVEPIQKLNQLGGCGLAGPLGVADNVGEQHRGIRIPVGDDAVRLIFQP